MNKETKLPKGMRKEGWKAYQKRNLCLKGMGFASYAVYLQSPLWKGISGELLASRTVCSICSNPSEVVHHLSYAPEVLRGEDRKPLIPLCRACHHEIEFDGDKKRSPCAVTYLLFMKGIPWLCELIRSLFVSKAKLKRARRMKTRDHSVIPVKRPFKSHNSLGKPLCLACGCNPRKKTQDKCGRCRREDRPIQWERLKSNLDAELDARLSREP